MVRASRSKIVSTRSSSGGQPSTGTMAPVEARIFIAGEAASEPFYGTAHGAWLEGERAAREALAALGLDAEDRPGDDEA